MRNKLDYITPEERHLWETAEIPIENYKNLAASICAASIADYRYYLSNMKQHYEKCVRYLSKGKSRRADYEAELDKFYTERAYAVKEESFIKSERFALFTNGMDPDTVINIIREDEGITNYIWNFNPEAR